MFKYNRIYLIIIIFIFCLVSCKISNALPSLEIISPKAGDKIDLSLDDFYQVAIKWEASNVGLFVVELSLNSGSTWIELSGNYEKDYFSDSYNFWMPWCLNYSLLKSKYDSNSIIRITGFNYDGNGNKIDIVSVNSGEFIILGSKISMNSDEIPEWALKENNSYFCDFYTHPDYNFIYIWWKSTSVNYVDIEYSIDGGYSWKMIEDNYYLSTLKDYESKLSCYDWIIPNISSDSCIVRVTDHEDKSVSVQTGLFAIAYTIKIVGVGDSFDDINIEKKGYGFSSSFDKKIFTVNIQNDNNFILNDIRFRLLGVGDSRDDGIESIEEYYGKYDIDNDGDIDNIKHGTTNNVYIANILGNYKTKHIVLANIYYKDRDYYWLDEINNVNYYDYYGCYLGEDVSGSWAINNKMPIELTQHRSQ